MNVRLREIATARSGDKGADVNIGVIARDSASYPLLEKLLTEERVHNYFGELGPKRTRRYRLPNLGALNFVLEGVLHPLRIDAQGKALAQALLEIPIETGEKS